MQQNLAIDEASLEFSELIALQGGNLPRNWGYLVKTWVIGLALSTALAGPAAADSSVAALRVHLRHFYPSLAYVDRYRRAFPLDVQGTDALWTDGSALSLATAADLVQALVGLQDEHVAIVGPKAGKPETLGALFRTSTDSAMIVWRVFDPVGAAVKQGDVVLSINGVPTADWLNRVQAVTFGGNRRSRAAEAALNLGLGTRIVHQTQGIGEIVSLMVKTGSKTPRQVVLTYAPMSEDRASALNAAINRRDLPTSFTAGGVRIGTVRLGAFAPQYDPAFKKASDEAAKTIGLSDDGAMAAGFCAVVRNFVAEYDSVAGRSKLMVLDLRGNMGGFGREARLLAEAITPLSPPRTFDVFASGKPGVLKIIEQPRDPACGHVKSRKSILVLVDAGTRSAGELMAAWMWAAGAVVAGERTIGAGGGFDFDSQGFPLPGSDYNVRTSGNFTFFDPTGAALKSGETAEVPLLDAVSADRFARSRERPFAIQAVGLIPDLLSVSTLSDLHDGGAEELARILAALRREPIHR
jgi:hypothetical protein